MFAHLAVADYLFRSGRLDDAAQTYQQILPKLAAHHQGW